MLPVKSHWIKVQAETDRTSLKPLFDSSPPPPGWVRQRGSWHQECGWARESEPDVSRPSKPAPSQARREQGHWTAAPAALARGPGLKGRREMLFSERAPSPHPGLGSRRPIPAGRTLPCPGAEGEEGMLESWGAVGARGGLEPGGPTGDVAAGPDEGAAGCGGSDVEAPGEVPATEERVPVMAGTLLEMGCFPCEVTSGAVIGKTKLVRKDEWYL